MIPRSDVFDLVIASGAKAQSCNGGFTIEEVFATSIGHKVRGDARSLGFFFSTKKVMEVFGFEANFGAGMGRVLGVILRLKVGVSIKKCAEISMASLRGNLACVHAKVHTHDGVETERRV